MSNCAWKVSGNSNLTMRTMEIAQTLQMGQSVSNVMWKWLSTSALTVERRCIERTYKKPSMKMPVNVIFCALFVFKDHTIGMGRHRTITSVRRLLTPVPIEKVTTLMHLDVLENFAL